MTDHPDILHAETLEAELVIARAERDRALECIRSLVSAFPDMGRGYTNHRQQCALRESVALLVESE